MQSPIALGANEIAPSMGIQKGLDQTRLIRLYKRNHRAALIRITIILILIAYALAAYCVKILNSNQFEGIVVCGLLLIAINGPRLWAVKTLIKSQTTYYRISLFINFLEIAVYTAVIYFFGGVDASFLTLLYAVLVTYVATVAPRRFSFLLAGFCALAFLSMTALETLGLLPHQCVLTDSPPLPQYQLVVTTGLTGLLFLIAYISAFTADRFRKIKDHLQEKNTELEITMKRMEKVRLKLREAHNDLERRVKERTAQLTKLTDQLQAEILEREKTEMALRESEENYRRIFENSAAGFFQSTPEGKFIKVNPAFAQILGYDSPEDLISSIKDISIQYYASPEDRKRFENQLKEKGHLENFETIVRRKDGSTIWISSSTRAYFDHKGKPIRYDGVIIDITERKRAEKEREKLQEQLIQAQKMESVGRLAGGVAHDFNNMLAVIMGHTELMLLNTPPKSPYYKDLLEIRNAARRSSDLTRQLLAFARKQAIRPKVLDLNETTEGMLKMLRRLIGEQIELSWKPQSELWPIKMDPSQLDQILANLCVNARDAIDGRGTITIETRNITLDDKYCRMHRGARPGDYVMLTVTDTGCGMASEIMDKIFEPFFTTKERGKGTGLGLSTVYGIVKQNDGYIDVDSQLGHGTTFSIYIPRYEGDIKLGAEKHEGPIPRGNGETILLAEDEDLVLNITKNMLTELGYRVLPASTPQEAIRLAQNNLNEIHLLITDIIMPEMNGKELSEQITRLKPEIKILFMSGYSPDVIVSNGVVEEGIHFIQKPFTPTTLAQSVYQILRGT